MFLKNATRLPPNDWKIIIPPWTDLYDFAIANNMYLFGSRSMAVRPAGEGDKFNKYIPEMIRREISDSTDYDLTLPCDKYIEDHLVNEMGFKVNMFEQQYYPDPTMMCDDKTEQKVTMGHLPGSLSTKKASSDVVNPVILTKRHNGFEYQILMRNPKYFDMFTYVWDRISPSNYYYNLWKSSPSFIGKDIPSIDQRRRLVMHQMIQYYVQYLNNHLV